MNLYSSSKTDTFDVENSRDESIEFSIGPQADVEVEASDLLSAWKAENTFDYEDGNDDDAGNEDAGNSPSDLYDNLVQLRSEEIAPSGILGPEPIPNRRMSSLVSYENSRPEGSRGLPASKLVLPDIKDLIFGFRLKHLLGEGSFARVFLASQVELANREVVLKISRIEGTEPQTLAQLQHTNVVPIYSVHEDDLCGLRAVCMPYFGGACLADVLSAVWKDRATPESGRSLIEALDAVSGPPPEVQGSPNSRDPGGNLNSNITLPSADTDRVALAKMTYVQAAAWLICRLAEGLHHSHSRNVLHRDIKPSNILFSAEAQPFLLDFNVSQAIDCSEENATLGGTIAYMSPEQLRAVKTKNHASAAEVTHQSDIYSLGLVLYEMLDGTCEVAETLAETVHSRRLDDLIHLRERDVPSLRENSPLEIPWSLESIVRKCLAPRVSDRYATAAQLADDLHRFLNDLPLKFAPELSHAERIWKWSRRHPKLTTWGLAIALILAVTIPGGYYLTTTLVALAEEQNKLADANANEQADRFQSAALEALCLVKTEVEGESTLEKGIVECDQALAVYEVDTNPDWQHGTEWLRLSPSVRMSLSETIRELLIVRAEANIRAAPNSMTAFLTALDQLDKAEQIRDLPRSRALVLERARYLRLLNREEEAQQADEQAKTIPVLTAHDTYMLAGTHTRLRTIKGYREAIRQLTQVTTESPQHFWSFFERGNCYLEIGETTLAASDFGTCVGLIPESAWAHFNRGYVFDHHGRKSEAVDDYTQAIKNSPKFVSAYLNRGLACLELRQYAQALEDFQKVNELGRDDVIVDAGRAMALEGVGRHDEADALFAKALDKTEQTTDSKTQGNAQRIAWTYAFAVAGRAPMIARRVFDGILKVNPKHPQALYGNGMLEMQGGNLKGALRFFDEALQVSPEFIQPLRYRAVVLARQGHWQQAAADANACTLREPANPDSLYIAACVASLSAKRWKTEALTDATLKLLESAIECGVDPERAASDPDFSHLTGNPRFQEIVGAKPKSQPKPVSDS